VFYNQENTIAGNDFDHMVLSDHCCPNVKAFRFLLVSSMEKDLEN